MTTKSQVRKILHEYLVRVDPNQTKITYPMKDFRHAVFHTVEICKSIQKVLWSCDPEKELTTCRFLFPKMIIVCTYDYKIGVISVVQEDKITECITPEQLPALIKSRQPKVVIAIRKKTEKTVATIK